MMNRLSDEAGASSANDVPSVVLTNAKSFENNGSDVSVLEQELLEKTNRQPPRRSKEDTIQDLRIKGK